MGDDEMMTFKSRGVADFQAPAWQKEYYDLCERWYALIDRITARWRSASQAPEEVQKAVQDAFDVMAPVAMRGPNPKNGALRVHRGDDDLLRPHIERLEKVVMEFAAPRPSAN